MSQIDFTDINRRRTTDRMALSNLLAAIKSGDVVPCRAEGDWLLGAFQFDTSRIQNFIQLAKGPSPYSALEVAEITGWKHECVLHWCNEGFLKPEKRRRGGATTNLIHPSDLADFQKRFIVVSDLAQQVGTSSRNLMNPQNDFINVTVGSNLVASTSRCHLVEIAGLLHCAAEL